ncbi:MAG: polysaccharide biosynthesis protein [Ruminococcaceae bacterium]|nr:polysaccharide biosynthesis protein [Oscillospiraceae bacterium]
MDGEKKKKQYDFYSKAGYKIKVYDYPHMLSASKKRQLREFDIEELLFRKPVVMFDQKTNDYYKDKVVLITGGGGSIGSELCRQLAKMNPKTIIILDIYENGAYDVQQELRILYSGEVDIRIEICSITNKKALERVFEKYHPHIVINAAAHKHVPLMENNCIEAVENNVFGCKNLVEVCEEYGTERFMMVSTDKAVNPTNVMGATKRMCEMIVQSASTSGKVKYSATRFCNVLGSAGSVIPLFKKQILSGGPITITDKRIIRYFMTIPEASQLVLQSGAMAKNGEIFVLDMGQPVKILDLAENMIRLSGVHNIEILETGLRPGEKLYEELLVKTEELDKTSNSLIFVERDRALGNEIIEDKLAKLENACLTGDDDYVRKVLKEVVPTFKAPEDVNVDIETSEDAKKFVLA